MQTTPTKAEGEKAPLITSTEESKEPPVPLPRREMPYSVQKSGVLIFFQVVSVLAGLAAVLLAAAQPTIIGTQWKKRSTVDVITRAYITLFAVLAIMVEMEKPQFVANTVLVSNWPVRGLFYTFLGVVSLEGETVPGAGNESIFVAFASYLFLGVGVLYLVMGLVMLHHLRDTEREKYHARFDHARLTDELESGQRKG